MTDDSNSSDGYAACEKRLDDAMSRLEGAVKAMESKTQSVAALQQNRQALTQERDKLSSELKRSTHHAAGLDSAAADVSRRLVDAMETVKTVLAK